MFAPPPLLLSSLLSLLTKPLRFQRLQVVRRHVHLGFDAVAVDRHGQRGVDVAVHGPVQGGQVVGQGHALGRVHDVARLNDARRGRARVERRHENDFGHAPDRPPRRGGGGGGVLGQLVVANSVADGDEGGQQAGVAARDARAVEDLGQNVGDVVDGHDAGGRGVAGVVDGDDEA